MKLKIAFTLWVAVIGVLAWQKAHADAFTKQVPSIELRCEQIGGVVFWDTGELEGANVKAQYVDFVHNTIYFTNGIRLTGERVKDEIIFDRSTLITPSGSFACVAE